MSVTRNQTQTIVALVVLGILAVVVLWIEGVLDVSGLGVTIPKPSPLIIVGTVLAAASAFAVWGGR